MRQLLTTLTFLFLVTFTVHAQNPQPPKGGAGGGQRPQGPPPSIGRAYGKVTDSAGQPLAQISAIVLKSTVDPTTKKKKLVLIKGMETKASGEFNFEDLPVFSPLVIRLSGTAYKSQDIPVTITMSGAGGGAPSPGGQNSGNPMGAMPSFEKDLGVVKLSEDVKTLSAATVTAAPPTMKLELDKKVFNVDKNIVSAGGTGLDVMRNVPSVNVDIDGNVTLRGQTPTIFVDGRPTTLTLDEIPADAIESVEVITNPSAKYDASGGGAGILNIILKKNRKQGYNGNISAGIDSHGMPNALAGFNIRQGKVNFNLNGLYNGMNGKTIGNTDRYTLLSDTTRLQQSDLQRNKGHFVFGQIGMDWFASNKTTLSVSYIRVHGSFGPTDISQLQTDILSGVNKSTVYATRNANSTRAFDVNGGQVGMKHLFAKDGESWTLDGSLFNVNSHSTALSTTDYYSGAPGSSVSYISQQQTLGSASPLFYTIQTDYTDPIGKKSKLEAGLRAAIQHLSNDNTTFSNDSAGHFKEDSLGVTDYKSTSRVFAAYVNYTSGFDKFSYALGLRAESSDYNGTLINVDSTYKNHYPLSLFPSVFLSQKLPHDQELQLSATRKITRPNFFQLIPYTDYTDTLNITRGNPNLVPQFTESFEMTYMKTLPHSNTLLFSAYYKYTSNLILPYQDSGLNPVGKPVLINTYRNASSSYNMGAEATATYNFTHWWDASLNINVYKGHINTSNLNQPSEDAMWSSFGKFNSNFKLPAGFTIQLTAIYQSKTQLPVNLNQGMFGPPNSQTQASSQGYIKAYYGIDLAIKKTFLKNNAASVTVTMTDIFRTRWSDQYSQSAFFQQEFNRLKDPQLVRVVFAYHFGKMDLNLFKRKDMNSQGMGDAGQSL
ncbi:MAG TPA: outer membrane beta-barrel protein [Puia sp.]|nr:outer membrane beta-barrel protein [Puia sp.]